MQSTSNGIVPGAIEPISDEWRRFVNRASRFPTGMALLLLFAAALANSQLQQSEVLELRQQAERAYGDRDADRAATVFQHPGNSREVPAIQSTLAYTTGLGAFAVPSFTNASTLTDTATSASTASKK